MSTTAQKTAPSPSAVIQEVAQFSDAELEDFWNQITRLRAERRAPHLSEQETELLLKINTGLPEQTWKRYTKLSAKLRGDSISKTEYVELLELIDVTEMDNAERIEYLVELANLRGTTLEALMQSLGIGPHTHD